MWCYDDDEEEEVVGVGVEAVGKEGEEEKEKKKEKKVREQKGIQVSTLCLLLLFGFLQAIIPLRHYMYHAGTNQVVGWTGEGELFSWRMMLTSKNCTGHFLIKFNSLKQPREEKEKKKKKEKEKEEERTMDMIVKVESLGLHKKQEWRAFQHPSYTIQLAKFIASTYSVLDDSKEGMVKSVKSIQVIAHCELNGNHKRQQCMNSSINLLEENCHVNLWLPMVD